MFIKGIMSNSAGRYIDQKLQNVGEQIGDPYEISRIRREDYDNHTSKSEYDDVLQISDKPARRHQGAAAFLGDLQLFFLLSNIYIFSIIVFFI
jgi:hypothetical protein